VGLDLGAPAPEAPSLDIATHTVSSYPGCGEVVIQKVAPTWDVDPIERLGNLLRHGPKTQPIRGAGDRERSERSAVQRARTVIRRWCVQNKADRGLTLTTRPECHVYDMGEAWRLIDTLRRSLREHGMDCMLIVPERCKGGQIHFHGAIPGWLDQKLLERLWGHGFVWIKKPSVPKGTPARVRSRVMAGYLSKYLGKSFGEGAPAEGDGVSLAGDPAPKGSPVGFNGKRYTTSRGTAIRKVSTRCSSMFNAYDAGCRSLGVGSMVMVWTSAESEDWTGPPTSLWHEGG